MCCVVVCKFGKGKEVDPVVLLIIDIYAKILFQNLIDSFGLSISLWVDRLPLMPSISQSEVQNFDV